MMKGKDGNEFVDRIFSSLQLDESMIVRKVKGNAFWNALIDYNLGMRILNKLRFLFFQ